VSDEKIERLIQMAQRLTEALEGDIEALKAGRPRALRTIEPEIVRLSAIYSREASSLNPDTARAAAPDLRKRLVDATARFRDCLSVQTRLLARMRGASEGMIRAIAEEVERQSAPLRTYGAVQGARPGQAMLYSSVV